MIHYDEQLVVYTIEIQTNKPRITKWQNDKIRGKAKQIICNYMIHYDEQLVVFTIQIQTNNSTSQQG